ncbi:unnamed protein product [Brassica rapa]|uniref:Histone-lysine N-methyltransferase, H3 lysine-9 specific SUVH1 n=1 Tax=Brassica campestris TaxID=3711 RepID=A0A3P6CQ77_BRACM|nr:unnamed protein product [Brassica rapa]VDD20997.1 unnamed protein product [Brassica rapa]
MCLVGLHSPSMAGIDYLVIKGGDAEEEEPIATSIVSSAYTENDRVNPDVLVYTGQGGHADKDKEASDQKLERGNLALEKSLHRNNAVRVIRGLNLKEATHRVKIYVYDGIYEIKEAWIEKGKSGHDTFKYKLVRAPNQPPGFATWTEIQSWKTGKSPRRGLILPDLTSGVESVAVSLVNEVDSENGPSYFTYSTTVKYSMSFQLTQPSSGCADEDASEEVSEEPILPLPLIISAKNIGNVARFMNHSCSPNVFWQPVSYENNGQLYLHVAFFAISHIPPMTELTYDYGVSRPTGAQNGNPVYGKKRCFCGTQYCRGSFAFCYLLNLYIHYLITGSGSDCFWFTGKLTMEGNFGSYTDKTRVLDIKPLRTLRPVFPSGNQAPPFVCAPPFGPFPPGFSPFYPFSSSQHTPDLNQAQNPPQHQPHNSSEPSLVTPLRTFRSPPDTTTSNGDVEPSTVKRKITKKRTPLVCPENFSSGISVADRENGNRKLVTSVIMRFDALRRRFSQLEDAKEAVSGSIKRGDLKAGSTCMSRGVRTNTKKRPGVVPGVEIGDVFFFRFEMCLVGLHSPSMAGIDYLLVKGGETGEEPIATSIVSSGYYDNDEGNPDVLVYTGQGGGNADKEKQTSDQKLERGNLALEKSLLRNSPVRVIRGLKEASQSAKIYVYDGLYEIKESWVEKGKLGHNTFKYKLVRAPGQPPAFASWIAIQKWKAGLPSREGLILPDLTSGVESIGVSLVNDVDAENGPPYFTYSTTVNYSESFKLSQPSSGCHCSNACKPGNLDCHCIRKNGGDFPYCGNGVLVSRKSMVHECSPSCPCSACKNKVTQMGVKVKLEVFKTVNRGWGLRSWDPIRAGSFICIYAGEAKDKSKMQQTMGDDDYTFDTTRVYTPFKWNYELGLADEDGSEEMSEEPELPLPLVISAKNAGNVARFMNHSCSPNVFWQPVSYEHNGQLYLHVAFFAMSHIPPMTELTYDYGVTRPSGTQNGNTLYGIRPLSISQIVEDVLSCLSPVGYVM